MTTKKRPGTSSGSKLKAQSSKLPAQRAERVQAKDRRRAHGSGGRRKGTGQSPRRRSAAAEPQCLLGDVTTTVQAYAQTCRPQETERILRHLQCVYGCGRISTKLDYLMSALECMHMAEHIRYRLLLDAGMTIDPDSMDKAAANILAAL